MSGWTASKHLRSKTFAASTSLLPRRLISPLAAAIALSLPGSLSHALSLGDIEVSSSLGQPLRARVPVTLQAGEELSADCISVVRADPFGGDANGLIATARVEMRQAVGRTVLFVSSPQAIVEPLARLLLRVSCADGGSVYREYTLLLDPPQYQAARAEPLVQPQAPPPPSSRYTNQILSGINEYTVRDGDTLNSIVKNRYPYNPRLQRRLRQAIAAANSDVLPSVDSPMPEAGTPLLIPELPPAPAAKPKPRIKPKRIARAQTPSDTQQAAPASPPPTDVLTPSAPAPRLATRAAPEFVLRLSRSAIDTTRPVSDAERASLRERQRLLDADDLTASMLALQHEMRQMKAEVEALKSQLRQQTGAPAAATVAGTAQPQAAAPAETGSQANWYERWTPLAQKYWWALPAIALAGLLAAMLHRRRRTSRVEEFVDAPHSARMPTQAPTIAPAPVTASPLTATGAHPMPPKSETAQASREHDVQARYLADRFPELAEAGIELSNTDAVVEQSRVYFMEDGAADKAIELLEYTTTKYPEQSKPWLALLEIYRQMKMKGAFEKHALAFRDRFKDAAQWSKVCSIGRALDPQNSLYAPTGDEPPAVAVAENNVSGAQETGQPGAQNWLDIPLDFTPALRGESLRSELLSELPEDRPEPKVPGQREVQSIDFELDLGNDKTEQERVEPKLARGPHK